MQSSSLKCIQYSGNQAKETKLARVYKENGKEAKKPQKKKNAMQTVHYQKRKRCGLEWIGKATLSNRECVSRYICLKNGALASLTCIMFPHFLATQIFLRKCENRKIKGERNISPAMSQTIILIKFPLVQLSLTRHVLSWQQYSAAKMRAYDLNFWAHHKRSRNQTWQVL